MKHPPGSDELRTQLREQIQELLTAIRKTVNNLKEILAEAESISGGRALRKLCRSGAK
jgi:hypothetical protein